MPPVSLVSLESVCSLAHVDICTVTNPYAGANREVKKAVEAYWAGKISAEDLTKAAADVKKTSWTSIKARGVDFVPR